MPVTIPAPPTVAIAIAALFHVPPGVPSLNDVVEPMHIVRLPIMATGAEFTVMTIVVAQPVGNV
jgi:hypothetical protein